MKNHQFFILKVKSNYHGYEAFQEKHSSSLSILVLTNSLWGTQCVMGHGVYPFNPQSRSCFTLTTNP